MFQSHDITIVEKPAFQAVGMEWKGTFAEAGAGGIRQVIQQMHERKQDIQHVSDPETLLGLSYHVTEGGFTHYSVLQVSAVHEIPEGMVSVSVPALSYARLEHRKRQDIDKSYEHIFAWIEEQGYKKAPGDLTHCEEYPVGQDPYTGDPEFNILIPILR
ncbi:AraC family transcriptional regulator [Paenibacillus zeisoli]|uniref:AraC family transcriptional regulator n=2 Tax=Paenibacillus zeisoli TaxID=2496267 RepID=A0A433XH51_9BACL|nr:GyrI-like domain-containing protein [Paenibacillus zeisoli]RUT33396.1 AraC family transcriptional regulator [Paenibacillus zeisoli]